MVAIHLETEMEQAIPFEIEYRFDQAANKMVADDLTVDAAHLDKWNRAFELGSKGHLAEAAKVFRQLSVISNMDAFPAMFHLALCHLLEGRVANAAIWFDRADAIKPNDYDLHIYAGMADYLLGLYSRAYKHWRVVSMIKGDIFWERVVLEIVTDEHHPERMALYPLCRGTGIDVGCGHRKTHPGAIGIDLVANGETLTTAGNVMYQPSQADIACSGDDLHMFQDSTLDYVIQRHNLEHYQDPIKALQEWIRVLKPEGVLGMVVPDDEVCDTIHLDKTHKHVFTRSSLQRIFDLLPGIKVVYLAPLMFRWSFVCVAQKISSGSATDFDYPALIRGQERGEIGRRMKLYEHAGLHGLASQCHQYLERAYADNP